MLAASGKRDIARILAGVLAVAAPLGAAAVEPFAEYGQCRFAGVGDGTFQQTDMHTDNFLHPQCGALGLQDRWAGYERLGWRVSLLGVGKIKARDNSAVNDEQAHHHTGACSPPDERGCALRFNGEGSTWGITAGLTGEKPLSSRLSLVGESGLFFYQHHFKAEARFVDPGFNGGGRSISFNETSKLFDSPAPYMAATLRYRDVYLRAAHYWPAGHRALTLGSLEWQLTVGAVFFFGGRE